MYPLNTHGVCMYGLRVPNRFGGMQDLAFFAVIFVI